MQLSNPPEEPVTGWRTHAMPEPGWLAGYSALIDAFDLDIPAPPHLAMVAKRYEHEVAPNSRPRPSPAAHSVDCRRSVYYREREDQ